MDPDYIENETKILDVDVAKLVVKLQELGAIKVYDDDRVITYLDSDDGRLRTAGIDLKVTDEDKVKVSLSTPQADKPTEKIKFKASRRKEAIDFLDRLGYKPVAEVRQRRISFEWEGIDFDIDEFPGIPAFMEIDLGNNTTDLDDLLGKLDLLDRERVEVSTADVYSRYDKNFFEEFKLLHPAS